SVREVRRAEIPRSRAREGPDGGAALGGQSAQYGLGVPRPAVDAGHGAGERAQGARSFRVTEPVVRGTEVVSGAAGAGRRLAQVLRAARCARGSAAAMAGSGASGARVVPTAFRAHLRALSHASRRS